MSDHESKPDLVACSPVSEGGEPPFKTEVVNCAACGREVWVTATLFPRLSKGELEPVCLPCLPIVAGTAGEDIEARIHPDQEQELAEVGLLDYARTLVATWNRLRDNGT